jgi:pimeloyl-ACP methyl ester carboxylesterase
VNSNPAANLALSLLSHDAAGLLIAALVAGVGALLLWRLKPRWPAGLVFLCAAILTVGSIVHILDARRIIGRYPAPGKIVTVDGQRIHVLVEGPKASGPTLVWFAGGHSGGGAISHLHDRLKGQYRSVLIDRPGTGWSGPAAFPRTTAREADEMWAALDRAGERGPFVLVGHSFGGLLVANMARRAPQKMHALVLLDATPPDTIVYGPRLGGAGDLASTSFKSGLLRLFGIGPSPRPTRTKAEEAEAALDSLPRASMAAASIYGELSREGMARAGWTTDVYDGALGDMPVYLVAPPTVAGVEKVPEIVAAPPAERARMLIFFAKSRERYMGISSRSTRIYTPAGTTHSFPDEVPDVVVAAVKTAADQ